MSINVYVLSQHSTILIVLFAREIRAILTLMRNFYKSRLRKANTLNIWFVLVFPSTGIYGSFFLRFVLSSVYLWYVSVRGLDMSTFPKAPRSSLTSTNVAIRANIDEDKDEEEEDKDDS